MNANKVQLHSGRPRIDSLFASIRVIRGPLLFLLEDPFSPEDDGYFTKLREQTSTPIAMGELFNNPNEYVP